MSKEICSTPEQTFALGEQIGRSLEPGDVVLLYGGLGAGKTLLTKGIMHSTSTSMRSRVRALRL